MKTLLTVEWVSWAAECVALKIDSTTIKNTMLQAGMVVDDIDKLLLGIKQLPGFTALERMTQKYTEAQAQLDMLRETSSTLERVIPSITENSKATITIDGHTLTIQSIFKKPNIVLFSNFLTPDECAVLVSLSTPKLAASEGIDFNTGLNVLTNDRTSYGTSFQRNEFELISRIETRIAKILNCPTANGEGLQVLKYAVGQQYVPHYDYFVDTAKATRIGGQRVGTLLMYLNTPEAGGATTFPNLGLDIQPLLGNAVFFSYPDDTDQSTLHGGSPVLAGEKWVATKWLRANKV